MNQMNQNLTKTNHKKSENESESARKKRKNASYKARKTGKNEKSLKKLYFTLDKL